MGLFFKGPKVLPHFIAVMCLAFSDSSGELQIVSILKKRCKNPPNGVKTNI